MALFLHNFASFVVAACTCTSLIFTSFIGVPSLVCGDARYLNWSNSSSFFPFMMIHPYVGRWSWLDAVDDNFAFVGADFRAEPSFIQSFSVSC